MAPKLPKLYKKSPGIHLYVDVMRNNFILPSYSFGTNAMLARHFTEGAQPVFNPKAQILDKQ